MAKDLGTYCDDVRLRIKTLGGFNVFHKYSNLTQIYNGSLKLWELMKYLITFRDEALLPEKIIDSLWPEADYTDPKRTLRALIFRLRKMIDTDDPDGEGSVIVYKNGCYKFETRETYFLDIIAFERLFHKACSILNEDTAKSIELFKEAITMYKGGYLVETRDHWWLVPTRNYYRNIYLQSINKLSELLKKGKRHQEIIDICEDVFKYEHLEGDIHYKYIEALAERGCIKQAKDHYLYTMDIFERELGILPSKNFKELQSRVLGGSGESQSMSFSSNTLFRDYPVDGSLVCDPEFFKFQYRMDMRRSERFGQMPFLCLFTLIQACETPLTSKPFQQAMEDLKGILVSNLRKGDLITVWSKSQLLLSLPAINIKQVSRALDRIQDGWKGKKNQNISLHIKIEGKQQTEIII